MVAGAGQHEGDPEFTLGRGVGHQGATLSFHQTASQEQAAAFCAHDARISGNAPIRLGEELSNRAGGNRGRFVCDGQADMCAHGRSPNRDAAARAGCHGIGHSIR